MNSISISNNYNIAVTEVLYILEYLPQDTISKIPEKFISFLKEHSLTEYNPNFDFSKGLNKLNLNNKTKAMLAMIYRNYICSEEERNEYDKILYKNLENYDIKMNEQISNKMFEHKHIPNLEEQSVEIINYKPTRWYKKIFNKIIKIFKGK